MAFVPSSSSSPPSSSPNKRSSVKTPIRRFQRRPLRYGFFLAENQPFIDGNKRTAAAAMATFLALNGFDLLEQSETELAEVFERLGSRRIGQASSSSGWRTVQPLDADAPTRKSTADVSAETRLGGLGHALQ
jgi:hypothetical protein